MGQVIKKDNFEKRLSLEERANALDVQHTQEDAQRLLREIHEKTERERERGYDEGYAEGLAELTERLTAVCKLEHDCLKDLEPQVLALVYQCAEKVIARELHQDKASIIDLIRGALRNLSGSRMTIRLNPEDVPMARAHNAALFQVVEATCTMTFKEDPTVAPGGCIIESEIGTIDAQLGTQLAALKKALHIG